MNAIDLSTMTASQFDSLVWDDEQPTPESEPEPMPADTQSPYLFPGVRCAADARTLGDFVDASEEQITAWLERAIATITPAVTSANINRAGKRVTVLLVGVWLWVDGTEYADKALRESLKQAGFKWASNRKMWCFATTNGGGRGKKDFSALMGKYGYARLTKED